MRIDRNFGGIGRRATLAVRPARARCAGRLDHNYSGMCIRYENNQPQIAHSVVKGAGLRLDCRLDSSAAQTYPDYVCCHADRFALQCLH